MTTFGADIFDEFLPEPLKYRDEAVTQEFYDLRGPDGENYKNISVRPTDEFDLLLSKRLEVPVSSGYSLLRVNFDGEMPNNAVHSDNGYDELAAILYLNLPEQCRGGTAFWRHKKYGWTGFPTAEQIRRTCKKPQKIVDELRRDYNDPSKWEQVGLVDMKFNRMVIYPTNLFHSRWPWSAWGNTIETGRLIWVGFFSRI